MMKIKAIELKSQRHKARFSTVILSLAVIVLWAAPSVFAAGDAAHGLAPMILVGVAAMLIAAKLGGELFERFGQPAVLGELMAGIALGALSWAGVGGIELWKNDVVIGALAEIGVILLLFQVGLESNIAEMKAVGWSSFLVAVLGVIVPFVLGWGVAAYFLPQESRLAHIFIGATLCATSVGITARVLKDLGQLNRPESRIVLGAAVVDDVLGLIILAVVKGAIEAAGRGESVSVLAFGIISAKAILFLCGALLVGRWVVPHLMRGVGRLTSQGVLLPLALAFCFVMAWLASLVGLAPIIGAFAAGLILEDVHFEFLPSHKKHDLEELLAPVGLLLVPIFFVLMGLKVNLKELARPELLGFAAVLTIVAIIGKQICSLGVLEKGLNRLAVGLGMIPRGEVGLIFAGIGATLMLPDINGQPHRVIDEATFGAIVIMVLITTLVTPPALKWALGTSGNKNQPVSSTDEI